jgi:hypothetical protein
VASADLEAKIDRLYSLPLGVEDVDGGLDLLRAKTPPRLRIRRRGER